ncbi:MAG: PQQ-like beta-propeller repeat protein [Phycisphaerales bacterium]|nr:MAG: PQQ-like beta-propeller repeat protein [Phycisphaerales bacterium]
MCKHLLVRAVAMCCLCMFAFAAEGASVWPTLHRDYQRSGYAPEFVRGPYERKWYRDFHDEMIATRVEAIVAEGKCYIGTFAGNLYALDVRDGSTVWTFKANGPIGASPCYQDGKLYIGADEGFVTGHLYCLDASDGSLVWKYDAGAGIWVSPACDGDKVYFGDRAGVFHAVSAATGERVWAFRTDGMILKPASFSLDGKRIVFGSEDMHVYCVDPSGRLLWKSQKFHGLSMRDQGPTIWQGLAIVRTNPADSFHTVLGRNGDLLKNIQLSIPRQDGDKVLLDKWNDLIMRPTPRRRKAEQDGIVRYLAENPHDQCFYAFDLRDGSQPWVAPVVYTGGLHNPPTPPAFNPKTGELYTFCRSALTYYLRGVRRYNALGRIDRRTGRFDFYWPDTDTGRNWYPVAMIGDETQSLSMTGDLLVSNHQGTLGGLDLKSQDVVTIWAGRDTYGGIFGPGAVQGGFDVAKELASQGFLTGMPNEWHGPDRSICAVADGRLFWVVGSHVVCIGGPDVPRTETGGVKPPPAKKSKLPWCVSGGNVAAESTGGLDESVRRLDIGVDRVREYAERPPSSTTRHVDTKLGQILRARLDAEVLELVDGWPWAPFVVQLGISGEERHFWRTAETMQIVSLALPHLPAPTKAKAIAFLDKKFESGVPLEKPVHSNEGQRREPYTLGPGMKEFAAAGKPYRANIEDLYAVWAYAHYADRWERVFERLDEIQAVFSDSTKAGFRFDHKGTNDEAEHLNAQIAGALAAARILSRADKSEPGEARELLAEMVTERVHHERADSVLIRPTSVASKGLHQAKVPRYVALVPEVGAMLAEYASAELSRNVRALATGLPVWYQAYGERMIGGENYISPPHLSRGLFVALADGVGGSAEELAAKLDQPWCKADLYYIEKVSAILRRLDSNV